MRFYHKICYLYSRKLRHDNPLWRVIYRAELDATQPCDVNKVHFYHSAKLTIVKYYQHLHIPLTAEHKSTGTSSSSNTTTAGSNSSSSITIVITAAAAAV